jgi:DNA-binding protein H-NS
VANGCNENIPAHLVFESSMVYIGPFQEMPMPKPNLNSASVDVLLKLRDEIEEVLAHRAALLREELSKLGHQIGSKGKVRGSSLKGRKVPVKFRDRSGNTWAGRGAQPVWLREKLKAGAKLEDFAVHKTAVSRKASPRKSKKRRRAKR